MSKIIGDRTATIYPFFQNHFLVGTDYSATTVMKNTEEQASLLEARRERKRAEDEVQALKNRIHLLKMEEDRSLKRIQQTKKRAEEIVRLREDNLKVKRSMLAQQAPSIRPEEIKNRFLDKEVQKAARRKKQEEHLEQKKQEAKTCRSQKQKNEISVSMHKREARDDAKKKMERVRAEREIGLRKLQQHKEEQRLAVIENYRSKVSEEMSVAKSFESQAQKLQKMEVDIISRLQETQAIQKKALDVLETALSPCKR